MERTLDSLNKHTKCPENKIQNISSLDGFDLNAHSICNKLKLEDIALLQTNIIYI